MAIVKPFKAVRPTRDKVSWVSCKALDVYSDKKLQSKLDFNPYTFLHVVNPAYKYSKQSIDAEKTFKLVKNRYLEFKEDKILITEKEPCLYIYKKVTPQNRIYCGIIGATSVEDYRKKVIQKHEATLEKREVLFENYLKKTGFNAEPVLLTYPDNPKVTAIMEKYCKTRAEYEFSSQDKNLHLLWVVSNQEDIKTIQEAFKNVNSLLIADGHHRTAASLLLAEDLANHNSEHNGTEDYNFFMSYLLPASQLNISSFHRFVTDLNGHTPESILMELDSCFKIKNYGKTLFIPTEKHTFSMYINGSFFSLELRKSVYNFSDEFSKLDSVILYRKILQGLLGIKDIRSDERMSYLGNDNDYLELKNKVDDGTFAISFGMRPVTFEEIKTITDQGQTLLPKTTYVEPKIRSAMTIYEW